MQLTALLTTLSSTTTLASPLHELSPRANLKLQICSGADMGGTCASFSQAAKGKHHLKINHCHDLSKLNDKVTSYSVGGGCCGFYANAGCDALEFTATDRSDGNIGLPESDTISSWKCNHHCKGL